MSQSVSRTEAAEFRFRLPLDWSLNSYELGLIHAIGMDGMPSPCKIRIDRESERAAFGAIIHVARNQADSSHVYFLFSHPSRGDLLISTGTLPVRDHVYDLLKELARGTLNRLRNQLSIWQEGGLEIPYSVEGLLHDATHNLAQSIMAATYAVQDQRAHQAIVQAVEAIFELSAHFGKQIGRYRCENDDLSRFYVGLTYDSANSSPELAEVYQSVDLVRFPIRQDVVRVEADAANQIENARLGNSFAEHLLPFSLELGQGVILGPWLDASQGGMREALIQAGDHLERRRIILEQFSSDLESLPRQVQLLHVASGINGIGHRHLSYPQQISLVADLLQRIDDSQVEVPTMVSFDFPWAERLASAVGGIHPLQIADSLLRQGTKLNYFGLEINLDFWPGGSAIRDPFQWIDLIDIWAQLELPLILLLRAPFGCPPVSPDQPVDRLVNQCRSKTTDDQRFKFLETILPMLVARPSVQGLIWSQGRDEGDSRFPFGGILDAEGSPKRCWELLRNLRDFVTHGDSMPGD